MINEPSKWEEKDRWDNISAIPSDLGKTPEELNPEDYREKTAEEKAQDRSVGGVAGCGGLALIGGVTLFFMGEMFSGGQATAASGNPDFVGLLVLLGILAGAVLFFYGIARYQAASAKVKITVSDENR